MPALPARGFLASAAAICAVFAGTPGSPASASPTSGHDQHVLFGGDVPLEQAPLGRRLAIVRIYGEAGPASTSGLPQVAHAMAGGATVLASVDIADPGPAGYAAVTAGRDDRSVLAFLRQVNADAVTGHQSAAYVDFEHEANLAGDPAGFIRAWDHVHALAVDAGLDWQQGGRLHWVDILSHGAYIEGQAAQFWPGPAEADIAGVDGYNTLGCRSGRADGAAETPADLFGAAVSFADGHRVPLFVAEWASYANPSQPAFIAQMQAYTTATAAIGAVMYWDSNGHGPHAACHYRLTPAGLAALAAMGRLMRGGAAQVSARTTTAGPPQPGRRPGAASQPAG